jgi:hypothetical protein
MAQQFHAPGFLPRRVKGGGICRSIGAHQSHIQEEERRSSAATNKLIFHFFLFLVFTASEETL